MIAQVMAIALGGALGTLARFGVSNGIHHCFGRDFPHGTLFVNVSGSFLMGFLSSLTLQRLPLAVEYRAAILAGFLGGYTTFSAFALETFNLFESGHWLRAGLNMILSVVLCVTAVWGGVILGR
ncbi:MAG: fluoride efflux transporter CrcB [Methylomonas sp.]|nr:fluoride efflux transporter CrcB [Methylomonas sp.]PPD19608.1 MAG: fluoride efflux transporter CrcB [Methylomonas sp.]PPD25700.1 MAG: fluoride efflux transporter CrcB [Methylomonas sp.]PPD36911.1 MAG: fluoride efflux transporter CrcB [Methylomonas sp.]PPD38711.1 MAG: fluoride efflux transporter CrcB [Methylomonas sp.]